VQFNFYDHSKVILSSHGLVVTHIDKSYQLTRLPLSEIMATSLRPPMNAEHAKRNEKLVEKLRYCKEVLASIIRNAGAPQTAPAEPEAMPMPPTAGLQAMNIRPSKASLR
jgi:cell cycle serine/threonine-protein kinase CDC5/MSD2